MNYFGGINFQAVYMIYSNAWYTYLKYLAHKGLKIVFLYLPFAGEKIGNMSE